MENELFKDRVGYVVGFLALVISLNNYKEELSHIQIDFILFSFNLSQYFLWLILGVIFGLHLFYLPQFIVSEKNFWKSIKKFFIVVACSVFAIIAIAPLALILVFFLSRLVNYLYTNTETGIFVIKILMVITFGLAGGLGGLAGSKFYKVFLRKRLFKNINDND